MEAAKYAFDHWSRMSGMERARIMIQAAHIIGVVKYGSFGFNELTDKHKLHVLMDLGYQFTRAGLLCTEQKRGDS